MAKIVVLDVDGTLMDTNYLHTEAWARAFGEVGSRVPREKIHKQIGKGSDQLIGEFVEDGDSAEKVNELHGEIYAELQPYSYPLPGGKELIASLHEKGYGVWFVTSAKPEELKQYLDQLETEGKLAGIVSSGDVGSSKPAPDIFEEALRQADVAPEDAVSVGDAVWDVEAAMKAGVKTVAVLTGGAYTAEELKEAGAVEVYEDCGALLEAGFPDNF